MCKRRRANAIAKRVNNGNCSETAEKRVRRLSWKLIGRGDMASDFATKEIVGDKDVERRDWAEAEGRRLPSLLPAADLRRKAFGSREQKIASRWQSD
jgi:hypothetical protein